MNLVAPANFSGLGELFNDFTKARTQSRVNEAMRLADLSNPESLLQTGQSLARAGDLQTGLSLAQLGRQMQTEQRQREADERAFGMLSGGGQQQMPMGGQQRAPSAPAMPAGGSDRASALMGRLQSDLGLTPVQAAGLVGNLQAESGRDLNPMARNPRDGRDGSDSVGMVQWNADRARALQQFALARNASPSDPNVQKDFILAELQGNERRTLDALRAAQTPEQAAAAGVGYLRPAGWTQNNPAGAMHFDRRLANVAALSGGTGQQPAQAPMQQQAPASPQMGDAMMRAQRIERALQMPSLSPAARQQLTGQLQALAPQIAAERQAAAPTDIQKNYEAARRQGFQGSLVDFMREQRQSVTVNNNNQAERAEERARGEGIGKRLNEAAADYAEAEDLMFTASRMEELSRTVEPGARTTLLEGLRQATGIRLDPNSSNVQAFGSIVDYLTPRMRVPGSGASSDRDVALFKSSLPSLAGSPEGNAIIMQTVAGLARLRMERARVAQEWQEGRMDARTAGERIRSLPDPFAEFKSWRENAAQREQRPAQGRQPAAETTIPRITTPEQHRSLSPGSRYIAPDGSERIKR
jgi:hypothetical protein